jgi:hypothetical protein
MPNYTSAKAGLDSPLYRPTRPDGDKLKEWAVDSVTAMILEHVCQIIATVRSYMFNEISEVKCKDLLAGADKILTKLASLPLVVLLDRRTPVEGRVYECCRLTAIIYCRAILSYTKFSSACGPEDLDRLYLIMNLVPNTRWKQIPGVWIWIICAVNPAASYRKEGLRLRMLLKNSTSSMGLIDFQILANCMESFMAVQRWIRYAGGRRVPAIPI